MPKTRLNRKESRRIRDKAAYANNLEVATKVRLIVEQLPNQAALDTFLLQIDDYEKREQMFRYCLPFIRFSKPRCPSKLDQSRIVLA